MQTQCIDKPHLCKQIVIQHVCCFNLMTSKMAWLWTTYPSRHVRCVHSWWVYSDCQHDGDVYHLHIVMSVLPMQTQCVGYIHSCADDDTTLSLFHSEDIQDDVVIKPLVLFVVCSAFIIECTGIECALVTSVTSVWQRWVVSRLHKVMRVTQCIPSALVTHILCAEVTQRSALSYSGDNKDDMGVSPWDLLSFTVQCTVIVLFSDAMLCIAIVEKSSMLRQHGWRGCETTCHAVIL